MASEKTPRPVHDDGESVSSYRSDAYTLPCRNMDDDGRSIMSVSSYESYDSFCPRERIPSYRVPKEQGASQPVYEAWTLCMSHETGHEVTKLMACGFNVLSTHDEEAPCVYYKVEPYEQQELYDMTLAAVGRYQAANKRCLPSRLIRGLAKPYEHDLDRRIQKLPVLIQSELNSLLRHREDATSNRFHRRDWTVAMMREQYLYRFASAKPEEVKRSGGLWKKKDRRRTEYFFVIRGADGKVATDDKGMHQPRQFGNPWKRVDEYERWERERAKDMRRFGKEYVQSGWCPRPRGRSLSPGYIPSLPPPSPPLPDFEDTALPPRRVRVERCRSRSRSRSRSPSFIPMPIERFPPFDPFTPGQPAGGEISPPPMESFSCGLPPPPQGGFPHICHGNCGLPGPHWFDALTPPSAPAGLCMPTPRPMPPGVPHPFEMPCTSHVPYLPEPINCPYPIEFPSPPPPPPGFFDYTDCTPVSSPSTPPPAPRPSNLTTPTTFSRATSNHTGSTMQDSEANAALETGLEVVVRTSEESTAP